MNLRYFLCSLLALALAAAGRAAPAQAPDEVLSINDQDYLEMTGLNVMLAHDFYPEGHQGGVAVIENGQRVATNGDLRLEPTPGQWQPTPLVGERKVDRAAQEISVRMSYPDPSRDRKGFNPITFPDLKMGYVVKVKPAGPSFRIIVDLDEPLPAAWVGKVGFNFELFPGILFGKSYEIGGQFGIFPRQANGPGQVTDGDYEVDPLGHGPRLTVAPESDMQRMSIEAVHGGEIQLLDGRAKHNNGWFVVRALVPAGATKGAIEWLVTPARDPRLEVRPRHPGLPGRLPPEAGEGRGHRARPPGDGDSSPWRSTGSPTRAPSGWPGRPARTGAASCATTTSSSTSRP